MAITLEAVKVYLRVDGTLDDDFLTSCIAAAESYLSSAVADFPALYSADPRFTVKADMVMYALISEMYRNRDPTNDGRDDYPYYIRSQITQLQNWVFTDEVVALQADTSRALEGG